MTSTEQIHLRGNKKAAKKLIMLARKQTTVLREELTHNTKHVGSRILKFDDGSVISIKSVYGHQELNITVPLENPDTPVLKSVELTITTGNVVFSSCLSLENDPINVFSVDTENISGGSGGYGSTYAFADGGGGGSYGKWESNPDDEGNVDFVSWVAPYAGFGNSMHEDEIFIIDHLRGYIYVNGMLLNITRNASYNVLGAGIRTLKGKKYIVVLVQNDYVDNWDFNGDYEAYDKLINWEAVVLYAEYTNDILPPDAPKTWLPNETGIGFYHEQDNPRGWKIAGYTELTRVLIDRSTVEPHWLKSIGTYQFSPDGSKAVSALSGSIGAEMRFTPNGWGVSQRLLSLTHPIRYAPVNYEAPTMTGTFQYVHPDNPLSEIERRWITPMYERQGKCIAIGYDDKNVLCGLFVENYESEYYRGVGVGFTDVGAHEYISGLFFADINGSITNVVKKTMHFTGNHWYYGWTGYSITTDYDPVVMQTADVEDETDHYVYLNVGGDGMLDAVPGQDLACPGYGVHWIDIHNKACSFCITQHDNQTPAAEDRASNVSISGYAFKGPAKQGMFVSHKGRIVHSYVKSIKKYYHLYELYPSYFNINGLHHYTNADMTDFTVFIPQANGIKYDFTHDVRAAHMQFAVIGDAVIGQLVPPAYPAVTEAGGFPQFLYYEQAGPDWIPDFTIPENEHFALRKRGGIFPRTLQGQFLDWAKSGGFDMVWDRYTWVYPTSMNKKTIMYDVDESGNILYSDPVKTEVLRKD